MKYKKVLPVGAATQYLYCSKEEKIHVKYQRAKHSLFLLTKLSFRNYVLSCLNYIAITEIAKYYRGQVIMKAAFFLLRFCVTLNSKINCLSANCTSYIILV